MNAVTEDDAQLQLVVDIRASTASIYLGQSVADQQVTLDWHAKMHGISRANSPTKCHLFGLLSTNSVHFNEPLAVLGHCAGCYPHYKGDQQSYNNSLSISYRKIISAASLALTTTCFFNLKDSVIPNCLIDAISPLSISKPASECPS